jgi:NarL family two-component system sensor histidine kinase LiaS
MIKKFFSSSFLTVNILWLVLRQQLKATVGTSISNIMLILLLSLIVTELSPWQKEIEHFLGIIFYSVPYFTLLGIISGFGILSAFFFAIWAGYPLGRYLKRSLQSIADAADAFSRGKLDYRLQVVGSDEVSQVGLHYNQMADRIEKQVSSLQRLVNENTLLVQQAEKAASLDERRKLARDLHDAVSQQLFAVSMTMAALPRLMDSKPEQAKAHLLQVEEMVTMAQQELRALIMHLRPVTLDGHSLKEGINQLLSELTQKYPDLELEWEIRVEVSLEQGIEDQLFRVIQEAISNVLRHAKANRFTLKLHQKQERLLLTLEDNGVGFNITDNKKSSYGITTMRERIEDLGGRFDLITFPKTGTRIEIRIPIQEIEGSK